MEWPVCKHLRRLMPFVFMERFTSGWCRNTRKVDAKEFRYGFSSRCRWVSRYSVLQYTDNLSFNLGYGKPSQHSLDYHHHAWTCFLDVSQSCRYLLALSLVVSLAAAVETTWLLIHICIYICIPHGWHKLLEILKKSDSGIRLLSSRRRRSSSRSSRTSRGSSSSSSVVVVAVGRKK